MRKILLPLLVVCLLVIPISIQAGPLRNLFRRAFSTCPPGGCPPSQPSPDVPIIRTETVYVPPVALKPLPIPAKISVSTTGSSRLVPPIPDVTPNPANIEPASPMDKPVIIADTFCPYTNKPVHVSQSTHQFTEGGVTKTILIYHLTPKEEI